MTVKRLIMKKSSRTRNSALNLITSIGGQLLVTVLHFVTRTVFVNTLGASYLGIGGLFTNILSMLSLTELGVATAIAFKLYQPLANNDEKRVRVLMKFYKQAYRVIGIAIMVLGLCLIPTLPFLIKDYESLEVLGINAVLVFILYLLQSVSSYLFFAYRSAIMRANQKKYILDIADYAVTIMTSVTQIMILIFLKDFVIYTASVIVFNIIKNIINAIISQKRYPEFFIHEKDSISKEEVFGLIKDCGALFLYKINAVVIKATDNLILSTFWGLVLVGKYSNYLLIYRTIVSILKRVYEAIRASMGNLFATESVEKQYSFFKIVNFMSVVLFGTAGVGVAVCANELIQVWLGEKYVVDSVLPVLIGAELLLAGIILNLTQIRSVSGVFRQMWYRPLLGILVNLGVSIALVQVWGISGVVVGTIATYFFTNFLIDPILIHKYSFNNYKPVSEYYKKSFLYIFILSAICAADMFICNNVFVGHGWFSVIVHILFVGLSVPCVLVLIFWKREECIYFRNLLVRVKERVFKARKN